MKKINVIVKKKFLDRYTGIFRKPGEKMTISEDRFREILRSGEYVEKENTANGATPKAATNEIKK